MTATAAGGATACRHCTADRARAARLELTVYGQPAPQGSKRHVGKGVMVESSKAVKPWRDAVRSDAATAHTGPPLSGPLAVTIVFALRKPLSAPKRRQVWPTRKPDLDKLARAVLDALSDASVWHDDAQVVDLFVRKRYAGDPGAMARPGARIAISPVAGDT